MIKEMGGCGLADFYGNVTGSLPAVMTDHAFTVLFSNASARAFPPAQAWLNEGRVRLSPASEAEVRRTVLPGAGSVGLSVRIRSRRYHLLCRRMEAGNLSVYLFAFVRGSKLPQEEGQLLSPLSGMRLLSACFAPRYEREYCHRCSPSALLCRWFSEISEYTEHVSVLLEQDFSRESVCLPDEALASVLTALLAVADGYAEGEIAIRAESRMGGFTVRFSFPAQLDLALTETENPALFCAAFRARLPQAVCAVNIALQSGFRLSASTSGQSAEFSLSCDTYDIGELGFKASDTDYDNLLTCLLSSALLLF